MGTRSITKIYDTNEKLLCCMYRQFDGYLSGHGYDLKSFLSGKKIINGISGQTLGEAFNGAGCMAAAIIAHFKKEIGGIYIFPETTQEFNYHVYPREKGNIDIKVTDWDDNLIYSGDIKNMPTKDD